jgi:NDP-sugar pyrophosphorylase family protein
MKVIIPLAGKDPAFEDKNIHKALAPVMGEPMIKVIADSRPYSFSEAIFILLREHQSKYNIDVELKKLFGDKIKIVWIEKMTEGAPCSILLAKDLINTDEDMLIDLADQVLDMDGFMEFVKENRDKYSGILPTFEYYYWKVGYVATDKDGFALHVVEKENPPISTHSTACVSYFSSGKEFVKYTELMIEKNDRIKFNNLFFVSVVYNHMVSAGLKVKTFPVQFIAPIGNWEGINIYERFRRPLRWKNESKDDLRIIHSPASK